MIDDVVIDTWPIFYEPYMSPPFEIISFINWQINIVHEHVCSYDMYVWLYSEMLSCLRYSMATWAPVLCSRTKYEYENIWTIIDLVDSYLHEVVLNLLFDNTTYLRN